MTIAIADMQSVGTLGWWYTDLGGASPPDAPSLSISDDGDGDAITATVAGAAGATHTLYYMAAGASAWREGNSRAGDGVIHQTGLATGTLYFFVVVSSAAGLVSLPSPTIQVRLSAGESAAASDLLSSGSSWLAAQRRAHMTRSVVYRRGAASVALAATVGRTPFWVDRGEGLFERIESRDYLVTAADLSLGGMTVLPERGDQIIESAKVYEVMAPADEPPYRYSDRGRSQLRIHTKYMGDDS